MRTTPASKAMKRYRDRKVEQGLCIYGGCHTRVARRGFVLCLAHRQQTRENVARRELPRVIARVERRLARMKARLAALKGRA